MKDNGIDIIHYEKAIAEKYGDEAVQNPRSNWTPEKEKEYLEQLKQVAKKEREIDERSDLVEYDGVLLPKKLLNRRENRSCPVCDVYSFSTRDDVIAVFTLSEETSIVRTWKDGEFVDQYNPEDE